MAGGSRPPPGRAPRSLLMLTSLLTGEIKWRNSAGYAPKTGWEVRVTPPSARQEPIPLPSLSHKCTRHPLASYTVLHIEQALKSYLFPLLASCHLLQADPLPDELSALQGAQPPVGVSEVLGMDQHPPHPALPRHTPAGLPRCSAKPVWKGRVGKVQTASKGYQS